LGFHTAWDRTGLEFATTGDAIEHSKELARRLRRDPRISDRSFSIVVIDESGAEVHCEPVYRKPARPRALAFQVFDCT
jgi:Domain of unknown function (DUF6894)